MTAVVAVEVVLRQLFAENVGRIALRTMNPWSCLWLVSGFYVGFMIGIFHTLSAVFGWCRSENSLVFLRLTSRVNNKKINNSKTGQIINII